MANAGCGRAPKGGQSGTQDPDRWLNLVLFLVQTGQVDKAETAVSEAKAALTGNQAPALLSLAQCRRGNRDERRENREHPEGRQTVGDAAAWYEKAHGAKPGGSSIIRESTQLLVASSPGQQGQGPTRHHPEATSQSLRTLINLAWARRTLALTLLVSKDHQQAVEALKLVEPIAQALAEQETGRQTPLKSQKTCGFWPGFMRARTVHSTRKRRLKSSKN